MVRMGFSWTTLLWRPKASITMRLTKLTIFVLCWIFTDHKSLVDASTAAPPILHSGILPYHSSRWWWSNIVADAFSRPAGDFFSPPPLTSRQAAIPPPAPLWQSLLPHQWAWRRWPQPRLPALTASMPALRLPSKCRQSWCRTPPSSSGVSKSAYHGPYRTGFRHQILCAGDRRPLTGSLSKLHQAPPGNHTSFCSAFYSPRPSSSHGWPLASVSSHRLQVRGKVLWRPATQLSQQRNLPRLWSEVKLRVKGRNLCVWSGFQYKFNSAISYIKLKSFEHLDQQRLRKQIKH
jgi:hypothetical protein